MPRFLESSNALVKQAASEWMSRNVSRHGAALAFYRIFAIAPLFVIVLAMVGLWFGEEAARRELFGQVSGLVGSERGEAIQALVSAAHQPTTGAWATVIAVGNHSKPEANQPAMFFHVLQKQRRCARVGFLKVRTGGEHPLALQGLPLNCGAGQTDTLPHQEPASPINHQL